MIKVIVCGAKGRMGRVSCAAVDAAADMELVAAIDHGDSLVDALVKHQPQAVVDFTIPDCVFENTKTVIEHGASPIVGASGLTAEQVKALQQLCSQKNIGGLIAPNFSLGAVLMMQAAAQISKHFPQAEIIEMHHDQKIDSPSGTAVKTAQMMSPAGAPPFAEQRARGETENNIPIHSVRLPGLFAHQMVLFGGEGESLTIRHDSFDRESMMPGVLLSIRRSQQLSELVYGLEHLLD